MGETTSVRKPNKGPPPLILITVTLVRICTENYITHE